MKRVSIIVPIYNREKDLMKCYKSLINQTYKNLEIILINDGSTDNSLEICQSFEDERIKIIDEENKGVSFARNQGIEAATGKYIIFIDADDYVALNMFEVLCWLPDYLFFVFFFF